tara:strand:+ start:210 stop:587 length:378 start_codon:yes stop_codon:yes gene_type:complete
VNIGAVNYLSLRLKLDDVVLSRNTEIKILENIRYCNKTIGDRFRVIFWNENLTEKECQKFIERNEKLLFEVNTKITKEFKYTWFLILSKNDKSNSRYTYKGTDIVFGISEYLKLAKFLIKKDTEE